MRKFMLSIVSVFMLSASIQAQINTEEVNLVQSLFGAEKQELVKAFINPSEATSADFWSIYNAYEVERKELGVKRIDLLKAYADSYGKTTDEQTNKLMKEIISLTNANNKLIDKYYKKLKKSTTAVEAAQFYQIEGYILSQIRVSILENIPFFGEFKNK